MKLFVSLKSHWRDSRPRNYFHTNDFYHPFRMIHISTLNNVSPKRACKFEIFDLWYRFTPKDIVTTQMSFQCLHLKSILKPLSTQRICHFFVTRIASKMQYRDFLRMVDNIQLSEFCMIDLRGTEDTSREKFRCRLDTEPQHTLYAIRNVVDSIFDHPCKYLAVWTHKSIYCLPLKDRSTNSIALVRKKANSVPKYRRFRKKTLWYEFVRADSLHYLLSLFGSIEHLRKLMIDPMLEQASKTLMFKKFGMI